MRDSFELGFAGQPDRIGVGPIAADVVADAALAAGLPVAEYAAVRRDEAVRAYESRNPQLRVAQLAGPAATSQEAEPYIPR